MSRPIPRARVEEILRACVDYREPNPTRIPGQTEQLCRALIQAWTDPEEVVKASARYAQATGSRPFGSRGLRTRASTWPQPKRSMRRWSRGATTRTGPRHAARVIFWPPGGQEIVDNADVQDKTMAVYRIAGAAMAAARALESWRSFCGVT